MEELLAGFSAKAFRIVFGVVFWLLASPIQTVHGTTVIYSAVDLTDTSPGQDLWQYTYWISDATFTANEGFSIFFDRSSCALLEDPPASVNDDWDLLAIQPDPILQSDGFYDGLALDDDPSLADPFTEKFVWLGTGAPGGQRFTIYNTDFSTREEGTTLTFLEAWRVEYFGSSSNSGDGADEADPDSDGASNLLEFLFAEDPTDPGPAPTLTRVPGPNLEFTYSRDKLAATQVLTHVEWCRSLDPEDWTGEGVTESILNDDGTMELVSMTLPETANGDRWFVRLRVTR